VVDPLLTSRFDDALSYAVDLHRGDVRKGKPVPYVAHLLAVCALVLRDGGTEDEAIAALLHDVLEDHPADGRAEEIEERFGRRVLEIVRGCTDTPEEYRGGPKRPWRERKELYIQHLRCAPPSVRRVAIADKLDNLQDLLSDLRSVNEGFWKRFNAGRSDQIWFYRSVLEALGNADTGSAMHADLERSVEEVERSRA
jgi:(p)ppGpp synthase/HD superfamily hydrolase